MHNCCIVCINILYLTGVHVYVIGIGLTGDTLEIKALATPPHDHNRFLVKDFDDLEMKTIRQNVFTKLCECKS